MVINNVIKETIIDDMEQNIVKDFLIVENEFYKKNKDLDLYNWKVQEEPLFIEKGGIGIFNKEFVEYDEYINEMDELLSSDDIGGVSKEYAVCRTPFGSDGDFSFSVAKQDNQIIAIKINFE